MGFGPVGEAAGRGGAGCAWRWHGAWDLEAGHAGAGPSQREGSTSRLVRPRLTQRMERCGCSLAFDLKQGRQEAVRCRGRRGAEATAAETGGNGEGGWIHLGPGEAA